MALSTERVLEDVLKLPAIQKLRTTVKFSLTCGAIVGTVTAVSSILGGPLGMAVGGIVSSGVTAYTCKNKFSSASYILLHEATAQEKQKLGEALRACLNSHQIRTMYEFAQSIQHNEELIQALVQIIIMFLSSEMGRKVIIQ